MSDDLARLAADLTKAAGTAQRKAGVAIRKSAFDVQRIAQQRAPVDTGALRSSIGVDLSFGSLQAVIGPTVDYAPYVEHGTRHQAPQPYMQPAADAVIPGLTQALEQLGGDIL